MGFKRILQRRGSRNARIVFFVQIFRSDLHYIVVSAETEKSRSTDSNIRCYFSSYRAVPWLHCYWLLWKTKTAIESTRTIKPNHMIRSNDEAKIKTKLFKRRISTIIYFCKDRQKTHSPCLHIVHNRLEYESNCTCIETANVN